MISKYRPKNLLKLAQGQQKMLQTVYSAVVPFSFSRLFFLKGNYRMSTWDRVRGAYTTGNPSSKYEHRRTSALLRNIQNVRICMGKKPIVSVTYENERISVKNSLPYLKCVLRLSGPRADLWPLYGFFIRSRLLVFV